MVGVLLAAVAVVLINRNRRFLVGRRPTRAYARRHPGPVGLPEVARVTYLRLEIVGPRMVTVVADVDLIGDDTESHLAVRLRALEAQITASPAVAGTVLSLSAPDEPPPSRPEPDRRALLSRAGDCRGAVIIGGTMAP